MKIYTKTGDKGQTGVIGGRLSKNSVIIDTIGVFDELNATLGVAIAEDNLDITNYLVVTQNIIFNIGSILSGANVEFSFKEATKKLENQIDLFSSELEQLTQFILPGGTKLSANIHLARTVCRRAERQLIKFSDEFEQHKPDNMNINVKALLDIQKFINRLSDYLFTLARLANKRSQVDDISWNKSID